MAKSTFKVSVCESAPELHAGSPEWQTFSAAAARERTDLFLLSELPFGPWISAAREPNDAAWKTCCRAHEAGLEALGDLGAAWVAASRPVQADGQRRNHAFAWNAAEGLRGTHTKQHFPDEEGYFEARWFQGGPGPYQPVSVGPIKVGFILCTEIMFNEHARHYGRAGAQVLLVPRVVGPTTLDRWLVAMRMAAIVSGCYVLSSNRSGTDSAGQIFGGAGWIINPNGDLVAQTSASAPIVSHDLDLDWVRRAQQEYPCYVLDMPQAPPVQPAPIS
jgi:N-carbamoylputrescine amidase